MNYIGLLIAIVLIAATCAGIGEEIGNRKGRGMMGFVLGLLFSVLGLLIVAVMSPTPQAQRDVLVKQGYVECSVCKEMMRGGATVCPHCQRAVSPTPTPTPDA